MSRWDPFTALARLDPEFDELVRRAWGTGTSGRRGTAGYVPAIDMRVEESDVVVTLELPGVNPDDVDIEVAEGRLTISGERTDTMSDAQGDVVVRELRYGSFRREFALPEGVGADDVEASYDRGMLHVRVRNVTKPAVAPRKVAIRRGGEGRESISAQRQSIEGEVESSDAS